MAGTGIGSRIGHRCVNLSRADMGSTDENRQGLDLLAQGWAATFEHEVIQSARARGELGNQQLDLSVLSVPLVLLRDQIIFGSIETVDISFIVDAVTIPVFVAHSRTSMATGP